MPAGNFFFVERSWGYVHALQENAFGNSLVSLPNASADQTEGHAASAPSFSRCLRQ
jgi:hypothetical protein